MIIRDTDFDDNAWGHGGEKRSAQISEILAEYGKPFVMMKELLPEVQKATVRDMVKGYRLSRSFPPTSRNPWQFMKPMSADYVRTASVFGSFTGTGCFLWENTRSATSHLPLLASEAGLKTLALPHNLESLVRPQRSNWSGMEAPGWFWEELEVLSRCAHVFTLSREEQWLLRIHGVDADFLPYHPPVIIHRFLEQIRRRRATQPPGNSILMLGSGSNPPTHAGMLNRIEYFMAHSDLDVTLELAGFNTASLAGVVNGAKRIVMHGEVDRDLLHDLLCTTRAVLVHQSATSGALTKVPEMLMAGVPVIMNCDSARTWRGTAGVYAYDDDDEFEALIQAVLPSPPAPERPVSAERRLVMAIEGILGHVGA